MANVLLKRYNGSVWEEFLPTPASHNQAWSTITSTPTTIAGYGITNAFNDTSTYRQLMDKAGITTDWVRTTTNGIIPYTSGGASALGTSSWPFANAYINTVYENGTALSSKYAALSHTQAISTISDATTVGQNLVKLTNPDAITFPRFNADNTVSALTATNFRSAIDAAQTSHTHTISQITDIGLASVDYANSAGSADSAGVATTANTWTTGRTLTIGSTGKSVNGSANVSWSLAEIGAQATITGAATSITSSNLTASRVLVSDASGKVSANTVTTTTLGYLDATSSIQTQLNLKLEGVKASKNAQTSATTTTPQTVIALSSLAANSYYQITIYGMWSKVANGSANAPVMTIAVDNTTGTPTWNGTFEWFQNPTAAVYATENNSANITTTTTTLGFQPTSSTSAYGSTYFGIRGVIYTGTSAKNLTLYVANTASTNPVYVDRAYATAVKVA